MNLDANTLSMLMSLLNSNAQSSPSRQSGGGAGSGNAENGAYNNENYGRGYNYAENGSGGTRDKRSSVKSNFAMENGLGEKVNLGASQNNDNKKSSFDVSSLLNLMRGGQNGGPDKSPLASVFGNMSGQGNAENSAQGLGALAPLLAMLSGGSENGNADMSQLLMSLLMSNMQKSRPSADQNSTSSEAQKPNENAAKYPNDGAAKNADSEGKAEEILKNELNNSSRSSYRSAGGEKKDKNKTQPKSKNIFQPIAFAGYAAISALNLLFGSAKLR